MAIRLKKQAWAVLRSEYEAGKSAAELSGRFGVSTSTIHGRASREKWRDRTFLDFTDTAEISALWLCLAEAAKAWDLGMAMAAVRRISALQEASSAYALKKKLAEKSWDSSGSTVSPTA